LLRGVHPDLEEARPQAPARGAVPADDREGHHLAADGRLAAIDRGEAALVPAGEAGGLMARLRKIVVGAPRPSEKDESEVRWLISYSDFMMQLVCLFIL